MTAPAPAPTEKAAPIPADVLALAETTAVQMLGDAWRAHDVDIIARAIMQDRADRASQEERIREDEHECRPDPMAPERCVTCGDRFRKGVS